MRATAFGKATIASSTRSTMRSSPSSSCVCAIDRTCTGEPTPEALDDTSRPVYASAVKIITTTEARKRFHHYVRLAAKGETIVITRRGVPAAQLVRAVEAER